MKPKIYTKKQTISIVNKSMKALGIDKNMKTDVGIIHEVLNEMKFDDFKTLYVPVTEFLENIKSKPQSLKPLLTYIKQGLITKNPAILEFMELAIKNDWFKKSKYIKKSIHVTLILEVFTVAMCNSGAFFNVVRNHIKVKEKERGIDSKHLFKTFFRALKMLGNFFGVIKSFSIDPIMVYFRPQINIIKFNKDELKKLYKNKEINFFEYRLLLHNIKKGVLGLSELVRINIYEAGISEYKNGFKENSICAHELSEDLKINFPHPEIKNLKVFPKNSKNNFYKTLTCDYDNFPTFNISQKWTSLYTTWNIAFVLSELNDLDIILPKLFIPSIINAKSENYAGARFISLWLSINNGMFRKYEGYEVVGPKNKKKNG